MAIYFDGDNAGARSRIDYGDLLNFDNVSGLQNWTCAIKIKLATAIWGQSGISNPIIGKAESAYGWELSGRRISDVDKIRFHTRREGYPTKNIDSGDFSDTSSWHTILITSEQISPPTQTLSLFVDDMDTAVSTGSSSGISNSGALSIGSRPDLGIDANLAHAAIWSGILTSTQRNEVLTDDPRTVSPSSLLFYSSCERGASGVDCRNLVTDVDPSGGVQYLTMQAERPSDFWPLIFGLRHGSSDGSLANQTFFVFPANKSISSAIIEIDEANTFDSDGGSPQFSVSGSIGSGTNYCWAPEATGLSPSTLYYYRLKLENSIVPMPNRTFTSWTSSTSGVSGTFIVASCSRFEDALTPFVRRDQDVVDLIRADSPDFFVGVDDCIYVDVGFHGNAWVDSVSGTDPHTRDFSENFGSHKNYVQLHEQFPCIYGLGDHEQNQDTDRMWKDAIRIGGNGGSQAPKYLWVNTSGEEYACTLSSTSGDPGFSGVPSTVFMVGVVADQGTFFPPPADSGIVGILASGEWGWDLYNGFYTIHVRMYNGTDPENYNRNIFATAADLDTVDQISQEYKNSYYVMRNWFFPGNPTPIPGSPSSPGDPLHFTFDYGPGFTFFVLDTRTQRDANNPDQFDASGASPPMLQSTDSSKTILGQQQEEDLLEWLDNPANHYRLKIILSPNSLQEDVTNSDDGWGQLFTADLERLKGLLRFKQNVIIMAGDTHYKTAARFRTGGDETGIHAWDLWELCASPIDSSPLQDPASPGNEISGVPNSYSSGAGDGYNQAYMRGNSSYSGTVPSFYVEYVDITGAVQYTSNTFTWVEPGESIDLFIKGIDSKNDNAPLFIRGPILDTDNIDLFVNGTVLSSGDMPLYTKGLTDISGQNDIFINGHVFVDDNASLHIEGHVPVNDNIPLYISGHVPINGNIDLFMQSYDNVSGSIPFYIKGKRLDFLDPSDVLFYHPLDSAEEYLQEIDWEDPTATYGPTIFVSGVIATLPVNIYQHTSSGYIDLSGANSFTWAAWARHFLRSSANNHIEVGFGSGSSSSANTLRLRKLSTDVLAGLIEIDNVFEVTPTTFPITPTLGWDLFVVDARFETSGWRFRFSMGGSQWNDLGVNAVTGIPGSDFTAQIELSTTTSMDLDEIILWKDNPLFNPRELNNLYELGNTHGQTMNFYSTLFDPVESDSITLYMKGPVANSGTSDIFTEGHIVDSVQIDLFVNGQDLVNDSISLYVQGHSSINDNIPLYMEGHTSFNDDIPLYINGYISVNDNVDLFMEGYDSISTSGDLFIKGHMVVDNNVDLSIRGNDILATSGDLFIEGFVDTITESGNITLYMGGHISSNNNLDLFIISFMMESGNVPLYIGGTNLLSDSIPLFIKSVGFKSEPMELFTVGVIFVNNNTTLYIGGISPISDSIDLFITSSTPESGSTSLYIGGVNVISSDIDLFISNIGIASGNHDLYMAGNESFSNNITLYINSEGVIPQSGNINLFINGIEPREAVSCPTLDPTASIQIPNTLITIYQSRIDALINQLGKNVYLEFDPIRDSCPNCEFDSIRRRSTGVYKIGGPRPFARGRQCPYCKGRGLTETPVNKCIKCLIKWIPEDAENYGVSIAQSKDIVRFKAFLTDADDLTRARTAIANHDIVDQAVMRVKLVQGPIPVGLREDRYCISFWETI